MNHAGGAKQQSSLNRSTGYSVKAKSTEKPSYLDPNSGSLQKPIEGRSCIGAFHNQKRVEKEEDSPQNSAYIKRGYKSKRAQRYCLQRSAIPLKLNEQ